MSVSHNGRGDSLKRESLLACRLRIMPSMHCSILASMFSFSPQRSMRSTEVHCLLSSRVRRRHGKSSICVSEVRWPNKHCGLHTSTQWIEWQLGIPCSGKLSRPSSGRAGEASQARAGVPVLAPSLPLTPRDGAQDGRELGVPSIFISWNSKFVVCAFRR